jgi:hypothetical protein
MILIASKGTQAVSVRRGEARFASKITGSSMCGALAVPDAFRRSARHTETSPVTELRMVWHCLPSRGFLDLLGRFVVHLGLCSSVSEVVSLGDPHELDQRVTPMAGGIDPVHISTVLAVTRFPKQSGTQADHFSQVGARHISPDLLSRNNSRWSASSSQRQLGKASEANRADVLVDHSS